MSWWFRTWPNWGRPCWRSWAVSQDLVAILPGTVKWPGGTASPCGTNLARTKLFGGRGMFTKAYIPYGGYYSSPFVRWQGTLQAVHSLPLGAATAKRWLESK